MDRGEKKPPGGGGAANPPAPKPEWWVSVRAGHTVHTAQPACLMNAGRLKISDDLRARAMVHCFVKKESIFCVFTLFLINQLESNGYLNWRQAALGKTRGRLKS